MPTIFTHAAAGLGLAAIGGSIHSPLATGLSVALAMLPDIDAVGLYLGIPYGSFLGHRGFSHSLVCAAVVGLLTGLCTSGLLLTPWWLLACYFFAVMASHGVLDALTNGGHGVAFFAPLDNSRYFFPIRPIRVSAIGMAFFRRGALLVLWSEFCWVWVPLAIVAALRMGW